MSVLRTLAATAGCAVVLGLAVTGYVRAQLSELEAAAASLAASAPARTGGDPSPPAQDRPGCATPSDTAEDTAAPRGELAFKARPPSSPASAAKRPSNAKGARPAERTGLLGELDRGIRKVGEGRYEIERRSLDLALGNLVVLSRAVRVAPEIRGGRPLGFRLFGIAPEGPFAKLGLRDDDVLVSINHLSLTTVEQVLEAYGKLKTAKHLVLGILHGGHKSALEYAIH